METIGSYMQREREFRKIAITEIAEATRISSGTIGALERNAFDELPEVPFVRGYLKAYAEHVGLDTADLLLRYEQYLEQEEGTESSQIEKPKGKWQWKWRYVGVASIVIAILALAAFWASMSK